MMTDGFMQKTGFVHCPKCGNKNLQGSSNAMSCADCGYKLYFNCAAATSCIIRRGDTILLAMRKKAPGKGKLDLPGGFVDYGESLEQGAAREIEEELGVKAQDISYFASAPNTYLYKGVTYQTLDSCFVVRIADDAIPIAADDVASIAWVNIADIDLDQMAFDSIKKMLYDYIKQAG